MKTRTIKILLGSTLMGVIYFLIGAKDIWVNIYAIGMPVEAAIYSLLILYTFGAKEKFEWILFPVLAALMNFELFFLFSFITPLIDKTLSIFYFAIYSSIGAFFYCFLLHFLSILEDLSVNTYLLVTMLCAVAGLPAFLPMDIFLPLHKTLWWVMFSIGLIWSLNRTNKKALTSRS